MKINDHCFLGKDLSYEQNFLEKIKKNLSKIFRILKFFLSEKGWWLYVLLTKWWTKKLQKIFCSKLIGWWMNTLKKNGLQELGWCSKYFLARRSVKYHKDQQEFKKTEIVEFYWFNSSPDRFDNRSFFWPVKLCNCMHCYFFINWFLEIKYE